MTYGDMMLEAYYQSNNQMMMGMELVLLPRALEASYHLANPAQSNESLNPAYDLDLKELESRNGFKSYDYVPLTEDTVKWLKDKYPVPGDSNFVGPLRDEGPGGIKPSLPKGSEPIGNLAVETKRTYIRQNESAKLLASEGYEVKLLDEIPGGNRYGIKDISNPDYLIENKVFDCYSPDVNTSPKTIVKEIASKTKDQAPNIVLNLDDYAGDIDELFDLIQRKATPNGDLKRLEELVVIKDGSIIKPIN